MKLWCFTVWVLLLSLSIAAAATVLGQRPEQPPSHSLAAPATSVQVLRLQEPQAQHMQLIGQLHGPIERIAVQGNYAYSVGPEQRLCIVDVSDRANPRNVGQSTELRGRPVALVVAGNQAYVACERTADNSTLEILDVSTPGQPTWLGSCDLAGQVQAVAVAGGYAYVAADSVSGMQLKIVDVSKPTHPSEVRAFLIPEHALFYDIVPSNPVETRAVATVGSYAYVAYYITYIEPYWWGITYPGWCVSVIDVSDPAQVTEVAFDCTYGYGARDLTVVGDYGYVALGYEGLLIINISDPQHPARIGSCDSAGFSQAVAVQGSYAYVAAGDAGLHIIDVSDPRNPSETNSYGMPGAAADVAVGGGYVYIAESGQRLLILQHTTALPHPIYLPLVHRGVRFCEESLYKVQVWEGGLEWDCDPVTKVQGDSSVRLQADAFSNAELYSPLIPVTPAQAYQVSYWVKANLTIDNAEVYGRIIAAQYTDQVRESDGVAEKRIDAGFSLGENVGGETDWARKSYTFTTHPDARFVRLRAALGLRGRAKGQVWFDGVTIGTVSTLHRN